MLPKKQRNEPAGFSLELNDNKTCPDVSCRDSQGLGDLTANKTNLWMCGLGICACFHVTLWVWVLFFEANLRFPDRAVFKMPVGVFGVGVGIAEFGLSFRACRIKEGRWILLKTH